MVVQAVDDLTADYTVSEATWAELGQVFTDEQRMDLVFTIGGYLLLAMAVNTFGVQEEHMAMWARSTPSTWDIQSQAALNGLTK